MINFIDKKKSKRKIAYCFPLVMLAVLLMFLIPQVKNLSTEKEEIEENTGYQVNLPIENQFKNEKVKIIEYKQNNDILTVSLLGEDLEEMKNYNNDILQGLRISEVNKRDNNYYQVKSEGKIPSLKIREENTSAKKDYSGNMREDFFLQSGNIMQDIDLLTYIKKEERREVSLKGDISNLINCFKEYSKEENYENLEFILEITDKELYILTFTASL